VYSWKSAYLRSGLVFSAVVLGLSTCNHPTGLLQIGEPYTLRTINGRALPYSMNGSVEGPAVTQGSFTFLAQAQAQRWERMGRRGATPGDSTIWEWMQPGSYYNQLGRVVVRYSNWIPGQTNGPRNAADTLEATASGGFILRQAGLEFRFCPGEQDC
jgi:hypothetical protein